MNPIYIEDIIRLVIVLLVWLLSYFIKLNKNISTVDYLNNETKKANEEAERLRETIRGFRDVENDLTEQRKKLKKAYFDFVVDF